MTQEEKSLLIKDLCARLPYNVVINCTEEDDEKTNFNCFLAPDMIKDIKSETAYWIIKPYLRPMSSMTEEEEKEYAKIIVKSQDCSLENSESATTMANDWYLSKGFDVRGLIPKGLALEASKDMYK